MGREEEVDSLHEPGNKENIMLSIKTFLVTVIRIRYRIKKYHNFYGFTFHIVSREPIAAGTNHTEFMMVISDGLWTN